MSRHRRVSMRTKLMAFLLLTITMCCVRGLAQGTETFSPEAGKVYDAATLAKHIYDDLAAVRRIQNSAARDLAFKDFHSRYDYKEVSVKGPVWKIGGKMNGSYLV